MSEPWEDFAQAESGSGPWDDFPDTATAVAEPSESQPVLATVASSEERALIESGLQRRRASRQEFHERGEAIGKPLLQVKPEHVMYAAPALSLMGEAGHGIAEGAANVASALTTPENIALIPAAAVAPEVVGPVFAGMMAKEAGRSFGEASVAAEMGDVREASRLATEGIAATGMAVTGSVGVALPKARAAVRQIEIKEGIKGAAKEGGVPPVVEPSTPSAIDAAARSGMRPGQEALSLPESLRKQNELTLAEVPAVVAPDEMMAASPELSAEMQRRMDVEVSEGLAAAFEKYQLAKQRQAERLGQGGKLDTSGETFSGLSKTPGFLESAEQRIIKRPSSMEPTVELPEITLDTPLKDVETIVRDRLEQRDWAGAVSALGQTKAKTSAKTVDKLLGVGRESVPLNAAERTIFNEIWDQALRKAGAEQGVRPEPPDLISRLESLKSPLDPGVGANPFPQIAKAVWNTALDIAIQSIKAGRHIKSAIDTALDHIRKNAQGFDEMKVREYMNDVLLRETTPAAEKGERITEAVAPMVVPPPQKGLRPLGDPYSEPIVERIGRLGKGPVSQTVKREALQIVDTAKRLVGELSASTLDNAKREAGALNRGTTWMNDVREITPRAAVGNFHEALETRVKTGSFEHVPEYARDVAHTLWESNLEIGQLAERAAPGFKASGAAQRMLTSYGMDIIRRGGGPAWEAWAEGLAKANDMELSSAKSFLRRWKKEIDQPGPSTAHLDRIAQDFKRRFPNVVTHVRPGRGGWHEIIHSSPFGYLEQAASRTAHAAAFREVYPMQRGETGGMEGTGLLEATRKRVMAEMDTARHASEFDNLIRALQGHPIDSFTHWWNAPDTPIGASVRALNDAMNPILSLMLSATSFRNIGETLSGGAQIFMGYRRAIESAIKEGKAYSDLERSGMVNRAILDFSFNPTAPLRSASRISSNTIRKAFAEQISNEFQEFVGASSARVIANEIRSGRLPKGDVENVIATMRAMGIAEADARMAVAGRNEAAVRQFETKTAEFLYGGNRAIAESSPLGASRAFTQLFRWHSYPMTKMRQVRSIANNLIESGAKGDAAQIFANSKLLAKHIGGTALAGSLTTGIMALIYEGLYGAGIRANEAQSDFPSFLLDSYIMAMGGPVQMVAKGMQEGGDVNSWVEQLVNASAPVGIANDLSRAVLELGSYEGLGEFEKIGKFLESKTPFARAIRRGMAVAGLSQENTELDAAIRGFKRWKNDKFGRVQFESHLVDDYDSKEFRASMKKAVAALQKGDESTYQEEIDKALNMENVTTKKVKQSLRGRKILKRPRGEELTEEDIAEVTKIIGDKGYDMIEAFDTMLNTL